MKRKLGILLSLILIISMVAIPVTVSASAGSDMTKVLDYYHKKNYKKAATYNKKLSNYANESCTKKMSTNMKKAYTKVLKGYQLSATKSSNKFLWSVYFSDIDNDKSTELLLVYGSREGDLVLRVYKYSNGKANKIAETSACHSSFFAYPDNKGIIRQHANKCYEILDKLTLSGKKIKVSQVGCRSVGSGDYFPLRQKLTDYVKYNSKGKAYIDYSLLTIPMPAGQAMDNVLKFYGKKDYKKAASYNNKLSTYANESCNKKMSSNMKKAYKKVLQNARISTNKPSQKYVWSVYFSDIDNDKNTELLLVYGSYEGDVAFQVYKYSNGKAKKIAETSAGHSEFYAYPDRQGIIRLYGQMGRERLDKFTLSNKKIKTTNIGCRLIGDGTYFPLHQKLTDYIKYNSKGKVYIDYSLLK